MWKWISGGMYAIAVALLVTSISAASGYFFGTIGLIRFQFVDPATELGGSLCLSVAPMFLLVLVLRAIAKRIGVDTSKVAGFVMVGTGMFYTIQGLSIPSIIWVTGALVAAVGIYKLDMLPSFDSGGMGRKGLEDEREYAAKEQVEEGKEGKRKQEND